MLQLTTPRSALLTGKTDLSGETRYPVRDAGRLAILVGLFSLGLCAVPSWAQTTPPSSPPSSFGDPLSDLITAQQKCAPLSVIKIDNAYHCVQTQTLPPTKPSPSAQSDLSSIVQDMFDYDIKHDPILAGNKGDQQALGHLPDASQQAQEDEFRAFRALMERYVTINASNLRGENKLNYQLLGYVLEQRLAFVDFDPARLSFTNDSGFFNMLSYIARQTSFQTPQDYTAYSARLSQLPRFFAQHKDNLRRGIKTDYTASAEIMPGIIEMVRSLAVVGTRIDGAVPMSKQEIEEQSIKSHPFFKPFTTFPDHFSKASQQELYAQGQQTFKDHVLPAYRDLLVFFEQEYLPHARKSVGIGTNPKNRDYYKALVKHFTTLELTPDQVHETGLVEVKRIRAQMDAVIARTGFEGDFKDFLAFLRTDPQFYAKTPEELLKTAAWIAKRIDGEMPKYFGKLPRLPYGVMAVPDEIAPNYTTGRYWGGNTDKGLAGNYVVNTYDLPQRPLYNLPALTLHEAVPGHHQQIALAQELTNVPEFRKDLYPNAFGEGWGLYAEKLGVEMGIYQTDYEHFGRLTYEMWRACRLVVDTGMHWKGWSRQQAEQCFLENTALSKHNIKTEVERYISWPGQALAYKIGEIKIWELRAKAQKELGSDFDIRTFHDQVLGHGGIPLQILDEQINLWIAQTKNNP